MKRAAAMASILALSSGLWCAPHTAKQAVLQKITVAPVASLTDDFMMGADISQVAEIEKAGGKFFDDDAKEKDVFEILKSHGINWVRLRLWNNPVFDKDGKSPDGRLLGAAGSPLGGGGNSIATDIPLAKRAKKAGMKLLLDFHYSDFWADPAKQSMPQDWRGLSEEELCNAVQKFTCSTIKQFSKAGAKPDMVQIGNELNNGFMWPVGKIWGDKGESAGGMSAFINLLKAASRGVRDAEGILGRVPLLRRYFGKIRIVIHLANGGDNGLYRAVFDPVTKAGVDFDVIGLSFYTYWHGDPLDLKRNMEDLSNRYGKDMIAAETAYAFTEEDGDEQGNVFQVYSSDTAGYAPTVQGQATAVRDVIAAVASVKGGAGVFYWEPCAIPVKGSGLSVNEGNTWENQAMFDFAGRALPSLSVWNLVRGKGEVTNKWKGSAKIGTSGAPYTMADDGAEVNALPGTAPKLPKQIKVLLENDSETMADVDWDEHDWSKEKDGVEVILKGTIKGANATAASKFRPALKCVISSKVNLITDPSFESGKMGEWHLDGPGASCFMENNKGNARTGKWTYKYWQATGFKSTLTRKIKVENGNYVLSVWAMGGGGENSIALFASGFDGKDPDKQVKTFIINTGWKNWKQYTVAVPVTSGSVTVGIGLDTNGGCWGNFDDVMLCKE